MGKRFIEIILDNFFVILNLVPIIIIFNLFMIQENIIFWGIVGVIGFFVINYVIYMIQENKKCPMCGKELTRGTTIYRGKHANFCGACGSIVHRQEILSEKLP